MILWHRERRGRRQGWALAWLGVIEITYRKVGGIRFVKLGWLNVSWSVTHQGCITE
jgi:hypothetical protein